ncbi:MAG TPA: 2'-5' RNA ligase family protein [Vicinamibacterales bacterium]|nr:2'-5' RNA ligase family protein [Vicinamibacterales bacterium]
MPPLIAVDVALLPPEPVCRQAVAINAALPTAESQGLRFDATHVPHVTLTQQFIDAGEVPRIEAALTATLSSHRPLALDVTGAGRGSRSIWMSIQRTPELDHLHTALMDALQPFERTGGSIAAFEGGDARPGDVAWVSGFRRSAAYGRFRPHITVGHASQLPIVARTSFTAGTIVLCRLGRFCSCITKLRTWGLGPVKAA